MKKVMEKSIFAKSIIARRKALGFKTQTDLAIKTGLAKSTIAQIESDVSGAQPETKKILAEALKCTVDDLYVLPSKENEVLVIDDLNQRIASAVKAGIEAAKPPPVSIQDDSAKGKLIRFVSNLSEKEAKHLYKHAQGIINSFRELEAELISKPIKSKKKT